MAPRIHFLIGIWLFLYSTVAYYLPLMIYDLNAIDFGSLPKDFYSFYCLFIAFNFSLVFMYALALFVVLPSSNLKAKILVLWLVVAEFSTLIDFILRKYFLVIHHSDYQMIATLVVFTMCCAFLLSRALHKEKSDTFFPGRSYIIRFKPVNIYGVINHLANLHGHAALYQDRHIYKFKKASGKVEGSPISRHSMESMIEKGRISIKEIHRNEKINDLIGRKYGLFRFNCNHLIKSAEKTCQN